MKKHCLKKLVLCAIVLLVAGFLWIPEQADAVSNPAKVSNVSVSSTGYNSLKVSWSKTSNATGYYIYRATSKNGSYQKVKTINGQNTTSWSNSGLSEGTTYYYKVKAYQNTTMTKTVTTTGKIGKVTANGGLNVRSGAGTGYAKLGLFAKDKTFHILANKKDSSGKTWYKLVCNGQYGYVSSQYVKSSENKTGIVKANGGLNVRKSAGSNYAKLGTLKNGSSMTIKGEKKAKDGIVWYKISYKSKTGYVSSKYIQKNKVSISLKATPKEGAFSDIKSGKTLTRNMTSASVSVTGSTIYVYENGTYVKKALPTSKQSASLIISGKTYTAFWQSANNYKGYNEFLQKHGCANTALTTVLRAYVKGCNTWTPYDTIATAEPRTDAAAHKKNYAKTMEKQMPISLYGISRVLGKYGVTSTYVQKFSSRESAQNDIIKHLKTGNPVVVAVCNTNQVTNVKDTRWGQTYHTMLLIGLEKSGNVIIADSANKSWYKGASQRFKVLPMSDVLSFMWSNSKTPTGLYWCGKTGCGGYLKVGVK